MKKSFIIIIIIVALAIVLFSFVSFNSDEDSEPANGKPASQITMKLTSPAFSDNQNIPSKYTCQGQDINPELKIEDIPENTQSLVLIIDDPDAQAVAGYTWDHWIVYNIQPTTTIQENSIPQGAIQGANSWGNNEYGGPCPPSGTHHYKFKLYALDTTLQLSEGATKSQLEEAMQGHILSQTTLIGLYAKS